MVEVLLCGKVIVKVVFGGMDVINFDNGIVNVIVMVVVEVFLLK